MKKNVTAFLATSAAIVVVPLVLNLLFPAWKVGNYAPGVAILLGVLYALCFGSPLARFTGRAVSPMLGTIIVGMGCTMNLLSVLEIGLLGLLYTTVGVTATLALGCWLGRRLRLEQNTFLLTSIGTAICGGSAIAAAAPVLKAKAHEIAFATATVFVLNALALMIYPLLGQALGFDQTLFGTWAALTVHDTSSVVGTTMAYGEGAFQVGVTLKLLRALWIVPLTLAVSLWISRRPTDSTEGKRPLRAKIPWFIPGFLIAATVATVACHFAPPAIGDGILAVGKLIKQATKYLLLLTLFWVGVNISIEKVKQVGLRPFLHGALLWFIVATTWCLVLCALR